MKKTDAISAKRVRELFDYEPHSGHLLWRKPTNKRFRPGSIVGSPTKNGYLRTSVDDVDCYVHRLIWLHQTGAWPKADVDHVNGDRRDNRWENLRAATRAQNQENQAKAKAHNQTGLLGAHKHRKRFASEIKIEGVRVRLGLFDTAEAAHQAYLAAKAKGHAFANRAFLQEQKRRGGSTA